LQRWVKGKLGVPLKKTVDPPFIEVRGGMFSKKCSETGVPLDGGGNENKIRIARGVSQNVMTKEKIMSRSFANFAFTFDCWYYGYFPESAPVSGPPKEI
jgi:hypothetical protein